MKINRNFNYDIDKIGILANQINGGKNENVETCKKILAKLIYTPFYINYKDRIPNNDYIEFIKSALSAECKEKYQNDNYELKIYTDFHKFEKDMYKKESEVGLTRMVAGYAWPWISKNEKTFQFRACPGCRREPSELSCRKIHEQLRSCP